MEVSVTGRHCELSDRYRSHVEEKLAKLAVEMVALTTVPPDEMFDAAILPADGEAPQRLTALRGGNRRMIIYLVGPMPESPNVRLLDAYVSRINFFNLDFDLALRRMVYAVRE